MYAVKICIRWSKSPHHSRPSILLHIYLQEKQCYKKNLYPYHVALTTKAKDRRLRRGAKEKRSYTARRNVFTCVLPRDPKHSPFSPTATVPYVSEKTVYLFRVVLPKTVCQRWSKVKSHPRIPVRGSLQDFPLKATLVCSEETWTTWETQYAVPQKVT